MNTILMSIKPVYVNKIFNGTKKYEFRKTRCKTEPSRIIVYSSAPVKKVVGELIIDEILYDDKEVIWNKTNIHGGIEKDKYDEYFKNKKYAVAYKIGKYIKYDVPKDLKEYSINNAPQSYVYIK